jgi:hypothetical protein
MPILTQPAFGPKLSIGFITGGCLIDVWCLVWRFTIAGSELTPMQRFWFYGFLLTGATFIGIGMFLGSIGRAARKAEMPPTTETVRAEENVQAAAAANVNPAMVAPMAGAPVAMVPGAPVATMPVPAMPAAPARFS